MPAPVSVGGPAPSASGDSRSCQRVRLPAPCAPRKPARTPEPGLGGSSTGRASPVGSWTATYRVQRFRSLRLPQRRGDGLSAASRHDPPTGARILSHRGVGWGLHIYMLGGHKHLIFGREVPSFSKERSLHLRFFPLLSPRPQRLSPGRTQAFCSIWTSAKSLSISCFRLTVSLFRDFFFL